MEHAPQFRYLITTATAKGSLALAGSLRQVSSSPKAIALSGLIGMVPHVHNLILQPFLFRRRVYVCIEAPSV